MRTFWITFVAAVVGGFLAKALSNRLDRAFRPPPSRHMAAWQRLIVRIAFDGQFRCMYCGQHYSVRNPAIEAQ